MTTDTSKILVWDAPVRVFHGLLVFSFAGAWLTSESERWQLLHITLGYTMAGLIAFRVLWGLVGTRYARFAQFVRGPRVVWQYLHSLRTPQPQHHTGHNPAGALAIVLLLLVGSALTLSGWASYSDVGGSWVEELHEVLGNGMLLLVAVHVGGMIVSSRLHRENLVRAMLTGRKAGAPSEGIARARTAVALALLALVLAFWCFQWQSVSVPLAQTAIKSIATLALS